VKRSWAAQNESVLVQGYLGLVRLWGPKSVHISAPSNDYLSLACACTTRVQCDPFSCILPLTGHRHANSR
jgi:hypothetical protein